MKGQRVRFGGRHTDDKNGILNNLWWLLGNKINFPMTESFLMTLTVLLTFTRHKQNQPVHSGKKDSLGLFVAIRSPGNLWCQLNDQVSMCYLFIFFNL